jgi:hypothetical protein
MIDTLKLNLEDCEITDKAQIVIEPSPYAHDTQQRFINYDLFVDNCGDIVQGKKAYLNTDKFNITIKPKYKLETDEIDKKFMYDKKYMAGMVVGKIQNIKVKSEKFNAGVFVQTSLPRYMNETNFNAVSISDEKKVLKQLEKDLWNAGIKTNIWNANLSRFDIFSNIITDESFPSYAEIFSMINLSSMQRFEYAGTTFLYRNGEQQICCYDKIFEIENKHKSIKEFKMPVHPPNVLRIENRLLKKRKIFDLAGFYRLNDLYKNYDFVKQHYRKEVGKTIFKFEPKDIEILTAKNFEDLIDYYWNQSNRKWFDNCLRVEGLASFLKLSNIETLFEAVDNKAIFSQRQKHRIKKNIQNVKMELDMRKASRTSRTKSNAELYNELKTKFYKAVA